MRTAAMGGGVTTPARRAGLTGVWRETCRAAKRRQLPPYALGKLSRGQRRRVCTARAGKGGVHAPHTLNHCVGGLSPAAVGHQRALTATRRPAAHDPWSVQWTAAQSGPHARQHARAWAAGSNIARRDGGCTYRRSPCGCHHLSAIRAACTSVRAREVHMLMECCAAAAPHAVGEKV